MTEPFNKRQLHADASRGIPAAFSLGLQLEETSPGFAGHALCDSKPMSILRYAPGQFYQPHYDYFSPELPVTLQHLAEGGQRVESVLP
jgi:hypothetical protein